MRLALFVMAAVAWTSPVVASQKAQYVGVCREFGTEAGCGCIFDKMEGLLTPSMMEYWIAGIKKDQKAKLLLEEKHGGAWAQRARSVTWETLDRVVPSCPN